MNRYPRGSILHCKYTTERDAFEQGNTCKMSRDTESYHAQEGGYRAGSPERSLAGVRLGAALRGRHNVQQRL